MDFFPLNLLFSEILTNLSKAVILHTLALFRRFLSLLSRITVEFRPTMYMFKRSGKIGIGKVYVQCTCYMYVHYARTVHHTHICMVCNLCCSTYTCTYMYKHTWTLYCTCTRSIHLHVNRNCNYKYVWKRKKMIYCSNKHLDESLRFFWHCIQVCRILSSLHSAWNSLDAADAYIN